jgi:hypothetical protein
MSYVAEASLAAAKVRIGGLSENVFWHQWHNVSRQSVQKHSRRSAEAMSLVIGPREIDIPGGGVAEHGASSASLLSRSLCRSLKKQK